ncbi:MAG: nuclear transport factor 2 family protein [Longimicrobiales bacterium]
MRFFTWMPWILAVGFSSHLPSEIAAGAMQSVEPQEEPDPVLVVRSMAEAFNRGDLEEVNTYFSDDFQLTMRPAFPRTSEKTFSGEDFNREWARDLIDADFRIEVEVLEAEGNRVQTRTTTWQDITRRTGMAPLVGIEDYVVEDGQITHLTWTATEEAWESFYAFRTKLLLALGVLVILALGIIVWLIRRRRHA